MWCSQGPHPHERMESERCKKVFHANGNKKQAGVVIFISDKIDFKTNIITRAKNDIT